MTVVEVGPSAGSSTLRAALGLLPRRRGDTLPGMTLVRRGVTVDRSHLAAYDRVCGFRLTDRLPATYPHVLAFPLTMRLLTDPTFPFPAIGLIHIANRIIVTGPLDAGARYDLTVHAADLRPHERGRQVDLHTTASQDGTPVWTSVSTYLAREKSPREPKPAALGVRPSPAPVRGPDSMSGSIAAPGSTPAATAVWRVPVGVGTAYAAVSGDRNPIHTSRIGARLFGFPRPIAHGMWSLAHCLAALEGRLPERYTVDVTFRQPILLPARVSFAWQPSTEPAPAGPGSGAPTAHHPSAPTAPTAGSPTVPHPGESTLSGGTFLLFGKKTHLAGQVTPG